MLKAARSQQWQRLSELEASRRTLLSSLFEGSSKASGEVLDKAVLVRIYEINRQVLDLVKPARDMSLRKIRGLGVGRKAVRAYGENKPLF
jgi:Flagellar protein FliT